MGTNVGMILLSSSRFNGNRLDIEDNIGEGIHIHYKNLRLDLTIRDFLLWADLCKEIIESDNDGQ